MNEILPAGCICVRDRVSIRAWETVKISNFTDGTVLAHAHNERQDRHARRRRRSGLPSRRIMFPTLSRPLPAVRCQPPDSIAETTIRPQADRRFPVMREQPDMGVSIRSVATHGCVWAELAGVMVSPRAVTGACILSGNNASATARGTAPGSVNDRSGVGSQHLVRWFLLHSSVGHLEPRPWTVRPALSESRATPPDACSG